MNSKHQYILFFLLMSFLSKAQNIPARHLKKLSDSNQTDFYHISNFGNTEKKSITFIAQDSLGQMWFATKDGLLRYDTKKFYTYKKDPTKSNSIGGIFVERILIGKDGSVWVGTEPAVLSKYRPETDDFITIEGINGKRIKGIQQDKDSIYWITTDKTLYRYDDKKNKLKSYTYKEKSIGLDRLLITSKNQIFITTNENYILEFFPKSESFKEIKLLEKTAIRHTHLTSFFSAYYLTEDYLNFIWITTPYGYLFRYNPNSGNLKKYIFETLSHKKSLDHSKLTVMFITEDSMHNLWFGTWFSGMYKIPENRKEVIHFMPEKNNPNSLSNSIIHSGFQDKAGYMWFGTEFSGINILKKNKKFFILSNNLLSINSFPKEIESIAVDSSNRVWLAGYREGLYFFDKNKPKKVRNANKLLGFPKDIYLFSLLYDSNNYLWIGTNMGLYKYNPETLKKILYKKNENDYNSITSNTILSLEEDKKGNIWIGTNFGVTRFNPSNNKFTRFVHEKDNPNCISNNVIRCIYCTEDNEIWIGTFSGLNRFNPITGTFENYTHNYKDNNSISANRINSIHELNGSLWVGTQGGGFNQFNTRLQNFRSYQKEKGLPFDNIKGISSDTHDNLWLTSSNNIIKFNTVTKKFIVYGKSDGLENREYIGSDIGWQDLEFISNANTKDKSGYLYYGGISGMTIFHPDSLAENKYPPPILIDKFSANGKDVNIDSTVVLKPTENQIELSVLSLNYIQSDKNQYAFYLENYDSIWHYTDTKNSIKYFDIPKGNYKLYYKASNNDAYWNVDSNPISINILPYFYKTKLFYIIIIFLVILLFASFILHRYYIKKKIQKQREQLKYSTSNLTQVEIDEINKSLLHELENSNLYLEPDLSLQKLASILQIKPNYLSQTINQKHLKNFNEFINSYRIREAKKLLIKTELKIEAVAYDSGFNSLSTFNNFFKKEVGITPSQFRKQQKNF